MQEEKSTLLLNELQGRTEVDGLNLSVGTALLFPVVGIGMSAGGTDALRRMVERLSPSTGMAYVVVQAIASIHDSLLPEIVAGRAQIPVVTGADGMLLEKDCLFLLPSGMRWTIAEGRFKAVAGSAVGATLQPVDGLLTALALGYKNKAIAVILSGESTDGTAGMQAVSMEGGLTFVQDGTARFRIMPRHAAASGYADFVLPPDEIGAQLCTMKNFYPYGAVPDPLQGQAALGQIYLLLSDRYRIDFKLYEEQAVKRRILHRMICRRIDKLETYLQLLLADGAETDLLNKELLLDGSGFFKDPDMYADLLKKIMPDLLKNRQDGDLIKIWVPECYTGEEAYSIAICLWEYWKERGIRLPLKIFATDRGERTIAKARKGFYAASSLQNVSILRLKRFFEKKQDSWQVCKEIRDLCVFAVHDLLKDPPYPRIDIICCERVAVILEPLPRRRIGEALHYALKSPGYLLTGQSEPMPDPELFIPFDKQKKIYIKKQHPESWRPDFNFGGRALALSSDIPGSETGANNVLLARYVPPSILVDKDLRIIRFYGVILPYLRPARGKASLHLFKMIPDELVFELHSLLEKVKKTGVASKRNKIHLPGKGELSEISIEVIPVLSPAMEARLLIVFQEMISRRQDLSWSGEDNAQEDHERRLKGLEQDLRDAQRQVLSLGEAFDKTREELQTANEEVLAANEELQSTNAQLESSREELRLANEELALKNESLLFHNEELKEAAEYAGSIVEAIREPLIVLNGDLRLYQANKAFYDIFRLRREDAENELLKELKDEAFSGNGLIQQLHSIVEEKIAAHDFEWISHLPDEEERVFLCRVIRMNKSNGRNATLLLTMENITSRKITDRQKDEFISIASHELKTPATSIQAYTQILHDEFMERGDERVMQWIGRLNNQVSRLTRLTKDLLDVTKIKEGQLRLQKKCFDLNALIKQTAEEMQPGIDICIGTEVQPELPELYADPQRIEQVLVNLLSNAIKYSSGGHQVIISTFIYKNNICFSVKDFGIGIAPEIRTKIFDRYFRSSDPDSLQHPGMGLGLYIAYQIVRQHGGAITLESEQGLGSTFTVSFPASDKWAG